MSPLNDTRVGLRRIAEDLHRTAALHSTLVAQLDREGLVEIRFDGTRLDDFRVDAERDQTGNVEEAIAAVAAAVHEYVMESIGVGYHVWPLCPTHGLGLHPEVHSETAVWWCRVGNHLAARIGELQMAGSPNTGSPT